jgi:hypothetical protein
METASANQAVKIDVKRQSKGPLSYAYVPAAEVGIVGLEGAGVVGLVTTVHGRYHRNASARSSCRKTRVFLGIEALALPSISRWWSGSLMS